MVPLLSYTSSSKQKKGCPSPRGRRDSPEIEVKSTHFPPRARHAAFPRCEPHFLQVGLFVCLYLRNDNHHCYLKLLWVERRGAHDLIGYLGPQGLELEPRKRFRLEGQKEKDRVKGRGQQRPGPVELSLELLFEPQHRTVIFQNYSRTMYDLKGSSSSLSHAP